MPFLRNHPPILRITAPPLAARTTIGSKLLDFADQQKDISIELTTSNSNLDFIKDNIDLAFRLGPITDELLVAKPLWDVPYTFCAGDAFYKQYKLKKTITRQQLLELPAIVFNPSWSVEGQNLSSTNIAHRFDELDLVMQAVERNMGVALLPKEILTPNITSFNVKGSTPTKRTMYAVYPSRRLLSSKLRSLIDYFADEVYSAVPRIG